MDKLWHCIRQFGKTGEAYFNEAVFLGEMCLFPNFCYEPSTYEVVCKFVDSFNKQYKSWDSSVGDLFVFAKPSGDRSFDKGYIRFSPTSFTRWITFASPKIMALQ